MTEHIIDLSEEAVHLSFRNSLLVIRRNEEEEVTLPLAELAVLLVSNPQVTYTHSVLAGVASAGAVLIVCNEKHLPSAMMLPLSANFLQTERFAQQASAPLPLKKRLWQQIVRAKVRSQANLLKKLYSDDGGLSALIPLVKSGDKTNIEARASRKYWAMIFQDSEFQRDYDSVEGQNVFLNYGYAVLRAIIARAICAAGLHPSLGLHHHNRYNPFCLADDIMEPFRPIVDEIVVQLVQEGKADCPLNREIKSALIQPLLRRFTIEGEQRSLFDIAFRTVTSLVKAFAGETDKLVFPEL
ncbi:MAG: type II CRISPR-associated endonuclease Cas1 [Planctomycetota bacterium]|nr:type II CRISPR-associated endonuclease Cas1 [Planctomycetota bacterium]